MADHVLSERDGAVTTITFNRSERCHCLNRKVLPRVKKLNGIRTEAAALPVCLCVAERREDR
jgi:hypothetical protein